MGNTNNKTDIHENYSSIEEFEADINKLADAISNVHDVARSTKLPAAIKEGMMYSGLMSLSMTIRDDFKARETKKALDDFLAMFCESDEEEGE